MGNENIKMEKKNKVGIITLSKPDGLNILDTTMLQYLEDAMKELEEDAEIRVIIITGEKNFSVGADIKEMKDKNPEEIETFCRFGHAMLNHVETLEKPVIAAVNGYAFGGGCELALACDIRIASENAKFGQPEVNLGIIPGFGGTQRLPLIVGVGKAKEMILTGKIIDAKEAEVIGLANMVVKGEELIDQAQNMAELIAQKGPVAVQLAKKTINESRNIQEGLNLEIDAFVQCFATQDHFEGINAFLEKRIPDFKGM
ncbi:MAG: crotonase [Bacteroidia bacterium]|nr:MAG: crotonase [Bacteroidia bacterium]